MIRCAPIHHRAALSRARTPAGQRLRSVVASPASAAGRDPGCDSPRDAGVSAIPMLALHASAPAFWRFCAVLEGSQVHSRHAFDGQHPCSPPRMDLGAKLRAPSLSGDRSETAQLPSVNDIWSRLAGAGLDLKKHSALLSTKPVFHGVVAVGRVDFRHARVF